MPTLQELTGELHAFDQIYDIAHSDEANASRGRFLRLFPLRRLSSLSLEDYVIGTGRETFCASVEAKTKAWAVIMGATAFKFGIYYGIVNGDPRRTYRFTKKFGSTPAQAYRAVRNALVSLISDGKNRNFREIDDNPLSQMFKAKILSLYFPDMYLNVCSKGTIEELAAELELGNDLMISEAQHLLRVEKDTTPISTSWSNPQFMKFLFWQFYKEPSSESEENLTKTKRGKPKVNFEDINAQRGRIGKISEAFALRWEKDRLISEDMTSLAGKIDDFRDRPGYGFDFLSFNSENSRRCIEVKSVGKNKGGKGYRFFLSENERSVSLLRENRNRYYFYLVFYLSSLLRWIWEAGFSEGTFSGEFLQE